MKKVLCAAVSIGFLLGVVSSAFGDPAEWPVIDGGNGHSYDLVDAGYMLTWDEANTAAADAGGYLSTVHSEVENQFIYDLYSTVFDTSNRSVWLGGYQQEGASEPDGGWTWVTGEPWTY